MPTPVSRVDNMAKHLTNEEKAAREAAEKSVRRECVSLTKPAFVVGSAKKYWEQTLARMEGIELLDDLDSETLGLYCDQLARRDELERLRKQAVREYRRRMKADDAPKALEFLGQADGLAGKVASLERQILQYADKLGLTPSGRFRIARKRAGAIATDPDDDLFG